MQTPPPRKSLLLNRRSLVKSAVGAMVVGSGMLGWATLVEPNWLSVCHYELKLPNLPSHWHGRRMVHISDLHIGRTSQEFLKSAMHVVNDLKPELLAITGDFLDHSGGFKDDLPEVLQELQPASVATVACLGNHDYGLRWSQVDVADHLSATASEFGIQMLRDQLLEIDGLMFLGIDDFWSPRCSPSQILESMNPQWCSICLCHNPDVCDLFNWSSLHGVILAGHTHGGQCKPPFLPPPILPVKNRRYTSGFVELDTHRQLFITRGLGHTSQVRFNCRPEVSVFNLQPA